MIANEKMEVVSLQDFNEHRRYDAISSLTRVAQLQFSPNFPKGLSMSLRNGIGCLLALYIATHAAQPLVAQDLMKQAQKVIAEYESEVVPIEKQANLAWWTANTTGTDEAFAAKEAIQNQLDRMLSNKDRFKILKELDDAKLSDPLIARQIRLMYLIHLEKQVDAELLTKMVGKANAIEKSFNVYRATVDGTALSDSEVRKILSESKDSDYRRRVWLASKAVGGVVATDLRELVLLRNEAARKLGFANYQAMMLYINEQTPEQILKIFDELDELTAEPYAAVKSEIDEALSKNYSVPTAELFPWHYQDPFFQEPPSIYEISLDAPFVKADIQKVCRDFYRGIGLPIDDVLARSDLYEKNGKSPHAFCTDIDRKGDVRVLANIVPNEYWMSTMLHELGHAVYSSKNIPAELPYLVRTDAHILTTEGVAMMFERFAGSSQWLAAMGIEVVNPAEFDRVAQMTRRNKLLIFSRWCQVMFRFEKSMYENPDQDLNQLWWDLVSKYQGLKQPQDRSAPDYASKIHVVSAPVYYHNYLLGELFACQLHAKIAKDVLDSDKPSTAVYWENEKVGEYMRQKVFSLGRTLPWSEMVEKSTGAPLGSEAFAAEFAGTPASDY